MEINPCYLNFNEYSQSVFPHEADMIRQYSPQKMHSTQAQQELSQLLRQNSKQNELKHLPIDNFMINRISQKKDYIRQGFNEKATWNYLNYAGNDTLSKACKAYNNYDINDVVGETSRKSSQDELSEQQLQRHSVEALDKVSIEHGERITLSDASRAQITVHGSFTDGVGHADCNDSLKNIPPEIAAVKQDDEHSSGYFIPNSTNLNAHCLEADSNPCSNNQVIQNQMVEYESIKNNAQNQIKSEQTPFQGQQIQHVEGRTDQIWPQLWQTSNQINATKIALNLQSQGTNHILLPTEVLKNNYEQAPQRFYTNLAETLQQNSQLAQSISYWHQDIKDRSFMMQTLSAAGGVSDQCNHATLSQRQGNRLAMKPPPAQELSYVQTDCGGMIKVASRPGQKNNFSQKQVQSDQTYQKLGEKAEIDENQALEVIDQKMCDQVQSQQTQQINAQNQWYANQIYKGQVKTGGSSIGDSTNRNFNMQGTKFISFNQAMQYEEQEVLPGTSEPELGILECKQQQYIYHQNSQLNQKCKPSYFLNLDKNSCLLSDHQKGYFDSSNFDEIQSIGTPNVVYSLQIPSKLRINPKLDTATHQSQKAFQSTKDAFQSSLATAHQEGWLQKHYQRPIINLKKNHQKASRALFYRGSSNFVATTPSKFFNQAVKKASSPNIKAKRCKNLVRKCEKQESCKNGTQNPEIMIKLLKQSEKNKLKKNKTPTRQSTTDIKPVGQYSFVNYKSPKSGKSSKSRISNKKRRQVSCQQSEGVSNLSNIIKPKIKPKSKNKAHDKKSVTTYRSSVINNQASMMKIPFQYALKLNFLQNLVNSSCQHYLEMLKQFFKYSQIQLDYKDFQFIKLLQKDVIKIRTKLQKMKNQKHFYEFQGEKNTAKPNGNLLIQVSKMSNMQGLAICRLLVKQLTKIIYLCNNRKRKLICKDQNNKDQEQYRHLVTQQKKWQNKIIQDSKEESQCIDETNSHNKFKLSTVKDTGTRGLLFTEGLKLVSNTQARSSALAVDPNAQLNMFIDIPSFSEEQKLHQTQSFQRQTLHQSQQLAYNDKYNETHPNADITQLVSSDKLNQNIQLKLQNSQHVMQETSFQEQNCFDEKKIEEAQVSKQDGKPQKTKLINEEQFCELQKENLMANDIAITTQIEQQCFQQQASQQQFPEIKHYDRLSTPIRDFENYNNQPTFTQRPIGKSQLNIDFFKNQDLEKYGQCSNIQKLNCSGFQYKNILNKKSEVNRKSQYLKSIDRIVNFKSALSVKGKKKLQYPQSQVFPCSSVKRLSDKESLIDRGSPCEDFHINRNNSVILPKKRLITSPKFSLANRREIVFQNERHNKSTRPFASRNQTVTPVRQKKYKRYQKLLQSSKPRPKGNHSQEKSTYSKRSKFQRSNLIKSKIKMQKIQLNIAQQNSKLKSKTPQYRAKVSSFQENRGGLTAAKEARCNSLLCTSQTTGLYSGGVKHSLQFQLTKDAVQKAERQKYQIELRTLQNQTEKRLKNQEFLWRNRLKFLKHSISAEKIKVKEFQEKIKEMGDKIDRQDKKKQSLGPKIRTKSRYVHKYNQTLSRPSNLMKQKSNYKKTFQQAVNDKKSLLQKNNRDQVSIKKIGANENLQSFHAKSASIDSRDSQTWPMLANEQLNVGLNHTRSPATCNQIQESRQCILSTSIPDPNENKLQGKMQLQSFADAVNDIEKNSHHCLQSNNLSQELKGSRIVNHLGRDNYTDRQQSNCEVQSQLKSSFQNCLNDCINVTPLGQVSEQVFASKVTFRNNERQNNYTSQPQCRNQEVRQYLETDNSVNNRSFPHTTEYDQWLYPPQFEKLNCSLKNNCGLCDDSRRNSTSILMDKQISDCPKCRENYAKCPSTEYNQRQNITMTETSSTSSQSDDVIFPEKLSSLAYNISQNKKEIKRIENILYKKDKKVELNKQEKKNMPLSRKDDQVQEFARKVRELAEEKIKSYSKNLIKQNIKSNHMDNQIFYNKIKKIDRFDR